MSSYISRGSTRSDMDDDGNDKDDTKRRSRNLSEKKRRDQFNMLINELSSMVSTNNRKMDKSTVLRSTIAFLKNHNEIAVRSRVHEIQEDWKPSFLSNEEFTHLILEALDGFIIVFSISGQIIYISESITSLLGLLPSDLLNTSIYDLVSEEDYKEIFNVLHHPAVNIQYNADKENKISFVCHCKRNDIDSKDENMYEPVQFIGYFRTKTDALPVDSAGSEKMYEFSNESDSRYLSSPDEGAESNKRLIFVCTGRLETPQLIREMSVVDSAKSEFTSRHSLEWKFLFLDHRAPPIIGYLPFEVLGTSGYDYYHVDDLDKVVLCHEALMQKGEGTSCFYRFLTKGQQWIWLQTRFYITYHQWTSKPEFIVCTHQVVSYLNVMKQMRQQSGVIDDSSSSACERSSVGSSSTYKKQSSTTLSSNSSRSHSKSSKAKSSHYERRLASKFHSFTPGHSLDSTRSISANSPLVSRHHTHRERTSHSSSHQITQPRPIEPKPQQQPITFLEMPPTVYNLTAVPSYPVQGSANPNASTEIMRSNQPIVMTSNQSEIQDQLQRKHEELQQLIVQQQEELRKIHEQLIMAKYGFLPPIVNAPTPCSIESESTASTDTPHNVFGPRPAMMLNLHQPNVQSQPSEELIPYQMSQQQAQLLISSNMNSPNS